MGKGGRKEGRLEVSIAMNSFAEDYEDWMDRNVDERRVQGRGKKLM